MLWGLNTIEVVGVVVGVIALLVALIAIVILLVRRCQPMCCRTFIVHRHQDTQVLVIEGPEEPESDNDSDT